MVMHVSYELVPFKEDTKGSMSWEVNNFFMLKQPVKLSSVQIPTIIKKIYSIYLPFPVLLLEWTPFCSS